ncbi:MAG: DUF2849 domain-containing protein [Variibacter sp.]
MPSVVTANHLRSGAVVYLARDGRWVEALDCADAVETPSELKALEALALAAVERNEVTAVYAFDVRLDDGRPAPVSVRERIRVARSPSI